MERQVNRDLGDTERRISGLINFGTVASADYDRPRLRVRIGSILTGWLPFLTFRAAKTVSWCPPELGEQVVVLAKDGDLSQGVVLGAIYQKRFPANGDGRPTLSRITYEDGTVGEYDWEAHQYLLDLRKAKGKARVLSGKADVEIGPDRIDLRVGGVKVTVSGSGVSITGNVTIAGSLRASGAVIDGGGNTNHHTH